MNKIGWAVPFSRNDYIDIVQQVPWETKDVCGKSDAYKCRLAERYNKIEDLNVNVPLLVGDS